MVDLDPIPHLRRIKNPDSVMRAKRSSADKRPAIPSLSILHPTGVATFFKKSIEQLFKLHRSQIACVGQRKFDVADIGRGGRWCGHLGVSASGKLADRANNDTD